MSNIALLLTRDFGKADAKVCFFFQPAKFNWLFFQKNFNFNYYFDKRQALEPVFDVMMFRTMSSVLHMAFAPMLVRLSPPVALSLQNNKLNEGLIEFGHINKYGYSRIKT